MREHRWPWLLMSALLLLSAVAAGWSAYLVWLPCRGSMLSGTIFHGYAYGPDFSRLCLTRMDSGEPFGYPSERGNNIPWTAELGTVAQALAGLAWLVVVLGARWSARTRVVAALPGVLTLALALACWLVHRSGGSFADPGWVWLYLAVEATAGVTLVAIRRWQPEVQGRRFLRIVVALWGTTAFGMVHAMADYTIMIVVSDANWDAPPGTGYLTVAVIASSALLTAVLTRRTSRDLTVVTPRTQRMAALQP